MSRTRISLFLRIFSLAMIALCLLIVSHQGR
jgi:hypothetical protein